jgi:hypothetical protein
MPDTPPPTSSPRETVEFTYAPARRPLRKRIGWAFRAWSRETFSRESLVSSLKSLLWVVPLTVLIWVYAERRQDVPMQNLPVAIAVRSGEPGRVVKLAASNSTVHIDLEGPQAGVEKVKDWLASATIPIEVPPNLSPGEHQIYLLSELNRLPRIVDNGVTIKNCEPSEATVDVDVIDHLDLEVKVRPEDAKTLGAPPIFNPARVRLIGPKQVLDNTRRQAAAQNQPLVALANLSSFKQQLAEPGKHALSAVPVAPSLPIDNPRVQTSPAAVSADVDVTDKAERTETLSYLRVLAAYRPDAGAGAKADQYKVVYDPTITNVTVTGPEQQIALLHDPTYLQNHAPAAIFEVNFSDPNPAPAPIMYELPPGVHVSEADAQRKITYTLTPRTNEPQ